MALTLSYFLYLAQYAIALTMAATPVAINKRMNNLKLGMSDGRLSQSW